jgi:HK97 family phage portal protein
MSFIDRLSNLFGGVKAAALPLVGQTIANRAAVPNLADYKLQITEGLYKNSAVQGCITALSSTLNEAPVIVVRPNGDYVESHFLERLFSRPNPHMSGSTFWKYITMYVYTGGNAYIHKVRSELTGAIVELYPYHSGQMVPIPSQYGWIDGYNYMADGVTKRIPASEIIHIKWTPDPLNPTVGLSPIEVSGAKIQALNEIDQTIYSQMRNNGVPGHLMFLPQGVITQPQREALREMWEQNFTGTNRGKLGVLAGDVRVERMAMNMSELQSEGLYGQLESAICGVFRVHPVVAMVYAGLLSSTYSNMETAFREFTTLTRVPTWKDWGDQLTLGLREELGGLSAVFDTTAVEALKSDPDSVIYPVIAMFNANLITQNEARERTGQQQVDDGDRYAYELNQQLGSMLLTGADGANSTITSEPMSGTFDEKQKKLLIPEEKAAEAWKQIDKVNAEYTDLLIPYVEELYKDAAKMAISLKANPSADRIDVKVLVDNFMKSSGAARRKLLDTIMAIAVADVGGDFSEVVSFVDEINNIVARKNIENITNTSNTMKKQIAKIISDNAGKSVQEIAEAINSGVKKLSEGRSRTIAQTVVAQQTSTTQENTWHKMNSQRPQEKQIVKVWITQRDDEVRDSHEALDGKYVDVGSEFGNNIVAPGIVSGSDPDPADFVNCRCIIRGVQRSRVR